MLYSNICGGYQPVLNNTMSQATDQIINWFNINKLNCNSNKTQQLKLKSKSKHCAPIRNDNWFPQWCQTLLEFPY